MAKKNDEAAPAAPAAGAITEGMANANVPATAQASGFSASAPVASVNGRRFKVKQITRNVIPQRVDETIIVTITGPIYQGEKLDGVTGEMAKMEAARLAPVINVETGELALIIANTVLEKELDIQYPDNSYVGRTFAITMKGVPGKRYKTFTLYELEEDTSE